MTSPPIQPLPLVMSTEEVAEVLRCSSATVDRYVYAHDLLAIQIGRERRFRADDVLEFIAARPTATRNGKARKRADIRGNAIRPQTRRQSVTC